MLRPAPAAQSQALLPPGHPGQRAVPEAGPEPLPALTPERRRVERGPLGPPPNMGPPGPVLCGEAAGHGRGRPPSAPNQNHAAPSLSWAGGVLPVGALGGQRLCGSAGPPPAATRASRLEQPTGGWLQGRRALLWTNSAWQPRLPLGPPHQDSACPPGVLSLSYNQCVPSGSFPPCRGDQA